MKKKNNTENTWKLIYEKFEPSGEGLREALCTLGNGYFATRGAFLDSQASKVHYPGTYIAGVYNKTPTKIAGRTIYNEDLVNCPNWLNISFKIGNGKFLNLSECKIIDYYLELDTKLGLLTKKVLFEDDLNHRTFIEEKRIVHIHNYHRAHIKYTIQPLNYSEKITIRGSLDGSVENLGVARYRQLNTKHLKVLNIKKINKNGMVLSCKTSYSNIKISLACTMKIFKSNEKLDITPCITLLNNTKTIASDFTINAQKKQKYIVEKHVSYYTSLDKEGGDAENNSISDIKKTKRFDIEFKSHISGWKKLWDLFDIEISGDNFSQRVIRLHSFHLLQTASPHNINIDAGMTARGLHGEAYRGHVFWDELFVMPFYDYRYPEISKSLLLYRFRRLNEARKYAKENGYKGAMFPWQSSLKGVEETQVMHLNPMNGKWGPDHSRIQRHVSFAIAFNVWQYYNRTNDKNFLFNYGAELIFSIAKFAISLVSYDSNDKKYHTLGIMGPDEFHEKSCNEAEAGLKDNSYTNILIIWTLFRANEILNILPNYIKNKLLKKLKVTSKEVNSWGKIAQNINLIINKNDIISQYDGYFNLKELNWENYKKKYQNIQRMDRILKAEGKSPNNYKVAKQADVLMMFYLFSLDEIKILFDKIGLSFNKLILEKNYDYYIKRTSHGSTLSKVVHGYISHVLNHSKDAFNWFIEVLKSDIYDIQGGTTPEGIHTGVMGGSIDFIIRGFAGIEFKDNKVFINPKLPSSWKTIKCNLVYRGNLISLNMSKESISIKVTNMKYTNQKLTFNIFKKDYNLSLNKNYKITHKISKKIKQVMPKRILIIDGDMELSEILHNKLLSEGFLVSQTHLGVEAKNILNTEWIDYIILAVTLQDEITGYELYKEIKTNKDSKDIPVILYSSKPGLKGIFNKLGVEDYIHKKDINKVIKSIKKLAFNT